MEYGSVLRLKPPTELFGSLSKPPIFINDLVAESEQQKELLTQMTTTTHDSVETVSTVPTCNCGKYAAGFLEHYVCEDCLSEVTNPVLRKIEPENWFRVPSEVGGVFVPAVWNMLSKYMMHRTTNLLAWMCNPLMPTPDISKKPTSKMAGIINGYRRLGLNRGIKSVRLNFDQILEEIILPVITNSRKRDELVEFVNIYRNDLFTNIIPFPPRVALVIEKTPLANYYDPTIDAAVDAIFIANSGDDDSISKMESRCTLVLQRLCEHHLAATKDTISGKPGILRRSVYGTRNNNAFRSIVTSMHWVHEYDTTFLPYHQLLNMLETVVKSKLVKKHGMTKAKADKYVTRHAKDYDDLIWAILEEIIDETPPLDPDKVSPCEKEAGNTLKTRVRKGRGLYCTMTRYPSLDPLSTQLRRCVGISRDNITVSVIALIGANMDFDGDQSSGLLILDNTVAEQLDGLSPHYSIHSMAVPCEIRNVMNLPDPTILSINLFLEDEEMVI